MKNMLIVGSEGQLGQRTKEFYKGKYNLICIDFVNQKLQDENVFFKMDLNESEPKELALLLEYLKSNKINLDAIIFLAAINPMSNFYSISKKIWDKTFQVNVTSFLFLLKKLYFSFSSQISIVAIASQNGVVAHEDRIDYGTSKAAMIHLIKNLTIDFLQDKEKDIKINCISPSYISNEGNKEYLSSFEGKKLLKKIPYKKFLENDDVLNAIDFLISDKSKAIRGQNLIIDYGYTII